jgi:hypothetical protein
MRAATIAIGIGVGPETVTMSGLDLLNAEETAVVTVTEIAEDETILGTGPLGVVTIQLTPRLEALVMMPARVTRLLPTVLSPAMTPYEAPLSPC